MDDTSVQNVAHVEAGGCFRHQKLFCSIFETFGPG